MLDGELGGLDQGRPRVPLGRGDQSLEAVVVGHGVGIEKEQVLAAGAGPGSQGVMGGAEADVAAGEGRQTEEMAASATGRTALDPGSGALSQKATRTPPSTRWGSQRSEWCRTTWICTRACGQASSSTASTALARASYAEAS